jgi:hypothetical protein
VVRLVLVMGTLLSPEGTTTLCGCFFGARCDLGNIPADGRDRDDAFLGLWGRLVSGFRVLVFGVFWWLWVGCWLRIA